LTGTLVNCAGIVAGSIIGVALKKGIPQRISEAALKTEGLGVFLIGLSGVLTAMIKAEPQTGRLMANGSLLLLISLVLGCICGEALKIDDRLNAFGRSLEARFGAEGFARGFVSASIIFGVGAMAVIGALEEGLSGNANTLYTKSMLDFTTALILASALGIGVLFSFVPILLLQGSVTVLARFIAPYITDPLLDSFCMVGYALVMVTGINFIADTRLKPANLMPAMIIPVLWQAFCGA
jgi:uncharacterized membrane protein YqgA involved in biofilm formation